MDVNPAEMERRFQEYYKHNIWRELAWISTLSLLFVFLVFGYDAYANPSATTVFGQIVLYFIPALSVWALMFVYIVLKHVQNDRLAFELKEAHQSLKEDYKARRISKADYRDGLESLELNYLRGIYRRGKYVRGGD